MARAARNDRSRRQAGPVHPGLVLAEALGDTPAALAAKWFETTPEAMAAVLEGRAPFSPEAARRAGEVFGTGAGPWLSLIEAWAEATAPKDTP